MLTFGQYPASGGGQGILSCLTLWKRTGVQGLRSLLFQPQPWSCGASVCFLDNRERKPPFRRPGRPQQPHTHRDTETHRQPPTRRRLRQHEPAALPASGREGGRNHPARARADLPAPARQPGASRSAWLHPRPRCPAPSTPPRLVGGANSGAWRSERGLSLRSSSLALVWCAYAGVSCDSSGTRGSRVGGSPGPAGWGRGFEMSGRSSQADPWIQLLDLSSQGLS